MALNIADWLTPVGLGHRHQKPNYWREITINLKTAKALGLTLPPTLIVRADEVMAFTERD